MATSMASARAKYAGPDHGASWKMDVFMPAFPGMIQYDFMPAGRNGFLGDRNAGGRPQSRHCHTVLAVKQNPFAACPLERAPQVNELPRSDE
jgi:hypothetical protein